MCLALLGLLELGARGSLFGMTERTITASPSTSFFSSYEQVESRPCRPVTCDRSRGDPTFAPRSRGAPHNRAAPRPNTRETMEENKDDSSDASDVELEVRARCCLFFPLLFRRLWARCFRRADALFVHVGGRALTTRTTTRPTIKAATTRTPAATRTPKRRARPRRRRRRRPPRTRSRT